MSKISKTCQVEKDIACFSPQTQDGITRLRTTCKPCRSNVNRHQANRWNKENREKRKEAEGRRRQNRIKKFREDYVKWFEGKLKHVQK